MRINRLVLTDFRKYSKKSLEFSPGITLLVGPNAVGKTNILEAIYALATGGSWRTETTKDMIRFGAEVTHVIGNIQENGDDVDLHLTLTGGSVAGKRAASALYKVDQAPRRHADFVGRLKVVLFEPESLEIVIGDPGHRRRFLDEVLAQTEREYADSLRTYSRALRSRNRLLDAIREGKARVETLEYWERALVKHGELIQDKRRRLAEWITDNTYKDAKDQGITLQYAPNVISRDRLDLYRDREILAGHTFVGPQRDEMLIYGDREMVSRSSGNHFLLASFGSRGEQRMAVLQLKLLEARWIERVTGESPVILLDDVFSELDEEHERMVGELVKNRQAIITATEVHEGHYPEGKVVGLP